MANLSGHLGFWASGHLGFWASGLLAIWASGLLGIWATGHLGFLTYINPRPPFTRFIKSNFENNKSLDYSTNIFVFCQMGISRSSTVILAYLIKEHDMSLLDAFNSLRESRDIIKPNFGFLKQLQDWEKVHTGHRTNLDDLDII